MFGRANSIKNAKEREVADMNQFNDLQSKLKTNKEF